MARWPEPEPSTTRGPASFATQSPYSSPGRSASLYDDLPNDEAALCRIVQGLVVHYRDPVLQRARVPRRRLCEVNTRYVDRMLERIVELDDRPLTEARPPSRRIIGCCRDFALLFTSMARHQGIPARLRVGFANYFAGFPAGFWVDHTVAEVWSSPERCWRLVDAEQSPAVVRENRLRFDPRDVPRDRFFVGGRAWQLCRAGDADANDFGLDPGHEPRGLWFVRCRLLLDLAALNKTEVLLWDSWDATSPVARVGPRGTADLDRIARNLAREAPSISQAHLEYASRRWRVPQVVSCYSPVSRPRRERLRAASLPKTSPLAEK